MLHIPAYALGLLFVAYWIVLIVLLISDEREPSLTLAWLLVLIFVPFVGVALYIFFGRDWRVVAQRKGWVHALHEQRVHGMAEVYERNRCAYDRFMEEWRGSTADKVQRAISAKEVAHILPASSIGLFTNGADKFASLKRDLANARRFIHLQYFIWEHDKLTAELTGILLDRLAAGVEVRITYDWLGSLTYGKRELRQLAAAGAHVHADLADVFRVNYRNHRKIAVIDGEIGYTGGMNVGQEYIDGGRRFKTWRDTHIRMTGQAVADLQKLFASRWYEYHRRPESLFDPRFMPAPDPACLDEGILIEVAAQGVEDPWDTARRAHLVAIGQAEHTVHIQSPYFVPDYSIYDQLINSALSGIEVRLMMTGIPDKRVPFWAAHTYFRRLIEAGGHVHLYMGGFFHAKTIVVDGNLAAVGTMNMDNRSLKLHKELMVWVFDELFAQQVQRSFLDDLELCHELTLMDLQRMGRLRRFRNQAARLLSDVL
jgi:cardiolipin synthase